jgi:hypothetical protein
MCGPAASGLVLIAIDAHSQAATLGARRERSQSMLQRSRCAVGVELAAGAGEKNYTDLAIVISIHNSANIRRAVQESVRSD